MLASSSATTKFGFRIRTRSGLVVEHLMIHGRDEADAERKLRQIYQHCEILECSLMLSASVTELEESPLSHWLFTEGLLVSELGSELGISPGSRIFFKVPTARLVPDARGPGDIDVLLLVPEQPERALAIEVKRVKISSTTFYTGLPGKLGKLEGGVTQANLLRELGFHRVCLLLVVETDGRERTEFNFAFRGPSPELMKLIEEIPAQQHLRSDVGFLIVYLTQPVDKHIHQAGGIGIVPRREPREGDQPPNLTTNLRALLAGSPENVA